MTGREIRKERFEDNTSNAKHTSNFIERLSQVLMFQIIRGQYGAAQIVLRLYVRG